MNRPGVGDDVALQTTQRWRTVLLLAIVLLGAGAAVSVAGALWYRELSPTPVLLVLGVACLVQARRYVPTSLTAEHRPALGLSAAWVVAGVVLYVVGPVVVPHLG